MVSGGVIYYGWATDTSLGVDEYGQVKEYFLEYNEQVLLDGSGQSGLMGQMEQTKGLMETYILFF